jgi:hypothetical protein
VAVDESAASAPTQSHTRTRTRARAESESLLSQEQEQSSSAQTRKQVKTRPQAQERIAEEDVPEEVHDESPEAGGISDDEMREDEAHIASVQKSSSLSKLSDIYSRLIAAGSTTSKLTLSSKGFSAQSTGPPAWKRPNILEAAQANSLLYSGKSMVAPALKQKPLPPPATTGKGWFDLKVSCDGWLCRGWLRNCLYCSLWK